MLRCERLKPPPGIEKGAPAAHPGAIVFAQPGLRRLEVDPHDVPLAHNFAPRDIEALDMRGIGARR